LPKPVSVVEASAARLKAIDAKLRLIEAEIRLTDAELEPIDNEATRSVAVNLARRFNAGKSDKKALLVA
jgi:hypothetical protein